MKMVILKMTLLFVLMYSLSIFPKIVLATSNLKFNKNFLQTNSMEISKNKTLNNNDEVNRSKFNKTIDFEFYSFHKINRRHQVNNSNSIHNIIYNNSLLIFNKNTNMSNHQNSKIQTPIEDFLLSFSLNFFSEIGDKSFFTIILLFNQLSPIVLFMVASFSELLMNLISVYIGYALRLNSKIKISCKLIGMITAVLYSCILMYEIIFNNKEKGDKGEGQKNDSVESTNKKNNRSYIYGTMIRIVNVFWIIFLSELGDKSQITTIILSTEYNPIFIFLGTALAHIMGILLSMTVGYLISKYINKIIISLVGAIFFLYFGVILGIEFFKAGGFKTLLNS